MTPNEDYWRRVRTRAKARQTDGCTGVPDVYVECCWEHDIHCDGYDINGEPINWAEAAYRFRKCLQSRSPFGVFSPVSWVYWAGVRWHGWRAGKD